MAIKTDLNTFADGAVVERFNLELQRIIENIADPNTEAKKARKLTLTVKITSDEKRDIGNVEIETKSTLVPAKPVSTKLIIDRDLVGSITGAELKSGSIGQTYFNEEMQVADDKGNVIDTQTGEIMESANVIDFRNQKTIVGGN